MENRKRPRRTWIEIPSDIAVDAAQCVDDNGLTLAEVCFHALAFAAWLAGHGLGHLLPQEHRARPGTLVGAGGGSHGVRFKQGREHYLTFKTAIEGAGSSIPAVLRTYLEAYVEAGGDDAMMNWPPGWGMFQVA